MSFEMTRKEINEQFEAEEKKVAGWLLYHEDRKKDLEKRKEEIRQMGVSAVSYSHEMKSRTNTINDSVANTVIKLTDIKLEKEIELIDYLIELLQLEKRVFLELRQKYRHRRGGRGRVGAYTKIELEYAEKMAELTGLEEEEVWKSERTLKAWWQEIIIITVRLALKRGLL